MFDYIEHIAINTPLLLNLLHSLKWFLKHTAKDYLRILSIL